MSNIKFSKFIIDNMFNDLSLEYNDYCTYTEQFRVKYNKFYKNSIHKGNRLDSNSYISTKLNCIFLEFRSDDFQHPCVLVINGYGNSKVLYDRQIPFCVETDNGGFCLDSNRCENKKYNVIFYDEDFNEITEVPHDSVEVINRTVHVPTLLINEVHDL